MFYPPEAEEWFLPLSEPGYKYATNRRSTTNEPTAAPRESCTIEVPFDQANMQPYLSPTSLFAEEE